MATESLFGEDLGPVSDFSKAAQNAGTARGGRARLVRADRHQLRLESRSLDELIAHDHRARTLWAASEKLDLSAFYAEIRSVEDGPGRPAIDPRILLVLWLYAISEGVGSARHLARLCREHDAYRWIAGGHEICHRLLSDFRVHHGDKLDRLLTVGASMGVAIPSFWLGLLLIVFFAINNDWLPALGYVPFTEDPVEWLKHLILPAFALGLASSATLTRQLRSAVVGVMGEDYIRTARAKGLSNRKVTYKHLLKNASIPAVTALGLQIPILLSGTVTIEGLFALNGIGQYAADAVLLRDIPVVQAIVLLSAVIVVFSNLAVDVSYGYFNPKTRTE